MSSNQSNSCATSPRTRPRRDSTPVLTALMLRVFGHTGSTGWVFFPKEHLFPTTLRAPTAMGSKHFVCSVSWGARPNTPTKRSKRPPARNCGSVSGCSYHCLSSTPYPPRNSINYGRRWAYFSFA